MLFECLVDSGSQMEENKENQDHHHSEVKGFKNKYIWEFDSYDLKIAENKQNEDD